MKPTIEQLKKFFEEDRFAIQMGAEIDEASEGHAICSMSVRPDHMNAGNSVMGGAMFTLADFAFAVAANYAGRLTVTLTSQISFIHSPRGNRLIAEAQEIHSGKSICFYNISVTDELGTQVANVSTTGCVRGTQVQFDAIPMLNA